LLHADAAGGGNISYDGTIGFAERILGVIVTEDNLQALFGDSSVYFVTFSIVDWQPVFVSEPAFKIVTESLCFCHREKRLQVNAYVIMPTHFHAIVFDSDFDSKSLESMLTDFRKYTGRRLCDYSDQHLPKCFG